MILVDTQAKEILIEFLENRKRNPALERASPNVPEVRSKGMDAAARDLVLESWGRLKQVVRDVAEARMVQPSALGKLGEAVGLLVGLGMLSTDYAQQIRLLYDLGQKVADSKGKLSMQDAHVYRELVDTLVAWIRRNLISVPPVIEQPTPPPPRRTHVGGYFPSPELGRNSVSVFRRIRRRGRRLLMHTRFNEARYGGSVRRVSGLAPSPALHRLIGPAITTGQARGRRSMTSPGMSGSGAARAGKRAIPCRGSTKDTMKATLSLETLGAKDATSQLIVPLSGQFAHDLAMVAVLGLVFLIMRLSGSS